ncbi:hypothetical protein Tco_0127916 [Tanacetum coccineum]
MTGPSNINIDELLRKLLDRLGLTNASVSIVGTPIHASTPTDNIVYHAASPSVPSHGPLHYNSGPYLFVGPVSHIGPAQHHNSPYLYPIPYTVGPTPGFSYPTTHYTVPAQQQAYVPAAGLAHVMISTQPPQPEVSGLTATTGQPTNLPNAFTTRTFHDLDA